MHGPLAIDNKQPGKICYVEEVVADVAIEYDLSTGVVGCSFPNPANSGAGAPIANPWRGFLADENCDAIAMMRALAMYGPGS